MHHIILGTAGHIDHGKSALVKALTGIDPDRLKEEKERGITIDLGFADLRYSDGLTVGIVDVPGHERLIRNMLAGAGGIDIVLFVIAADEGVMPQSREHLNICNLLNIKTGIIAITKADLVDDDWLELVMEDVQSFVRGSFLEDAEIIPVSAKTMTNIDPLKEKIRTVALNVEPKSEKGIFRLPVDRVFTLKGFGTVVTGTAVSGSISTNDEVEILPSNIRSKVRGLHSHGRSIGTAYAGQRVAINLQGVEKDALKRGDAVVAPNRFLPTTTLDVKINLLPNSAELKSREDVHFHIGTSETMARIVLYDKNRIMPGESWYGQLRLNAPVIAAAGDRFIVRSFSPVDTIGGGEVLDPTAHKMSHRKALENLQVLDTGKLDEKIAEKIKRCDIQGISVPFIEGWTDEDASIVNECLETLKEEGVIIQYEDILLHKSHVYRCEEMARGTLKYYHERNPLKPGMPKEELRSCLNMNAGLFDCICSNMSGIALEKDIVRLPEFRGVLSHEDLNLKDKILEVIERAGCRPPTREEICQSFSMEERRASDILKILTREGRLKRINDSLYLSSTVYEKMVAQLCEFYKTKKEMSVRNYKDYCGVPGKYAIVFLNYLDSAGITRRIGDVRILLAEKRRHEKNMAETVVQ
ncbi:MAG: selenocysteine-specific translation elongation factor [Nitrospirota bacterium]